MNRYAMNSTLAGLALAALPAPALAHELEPKCPVEDGSCWIELVRAVMEGPYVNGKMHGRWTERFADGSTKVVVEFRHGVRVE